MDALIEKFHGIVTLQDVRVLEKNINIHLPLEGIKPIEQYRPIISIEDVIRESQQLILKIITVSVVGNEDYFMGQFKVVYAFEVNNLKEYTSGHSGVYRELNDWLDNVVLATTRGIMLTEFRGTLLSNFILPITLPSNTHQS